ncbi:MAG: hypothetical protein MZW92_36515 [Comamonadaceae bacterium]|nr:hypothetical protein [Comamonadaceae bacterium]
MAGLLLVAVAGLMAVAGRHAGTRPPRGAASLRRRHPARRFGIAMVFVLLTFGGWNEAAYISRRGQGRAARDRCARCVLSIAVITAASTCCSCWRLLARAGLRRHEGEQGGRRRRAARGLRSDRRAR